MGGQACVLYGAAEFSRDCDIVLGLEPENIARLEQALNELQAECIAVPPFEIDYLRRGHAVHFRCHCEEANAVRLDVMSSMRGCDAFERLWERRTTIGIEDIPNIEVLEIGDLIQAKKTQRDKDWPMIRRLVDAHYEAFRHEPTDERVQFWCAESRSPELLFELASLWPHQVEDTAKNRPLLEHALQGNQSELEQGLAVEQGNEREADRTYWNPLRQELEVLRRQKRLGQ